MGVKLLPFLLIVSLIACCIEVDISVPGFPEMAHYYNVSEGTIQLTIAYNFLGFCLASIFYGFLSECFGRRRIVLIGNALLVIGALGCVVTLSINGLFAARFIQGIGASAAAVIVFVMIADVYQGHHAVKLIGIMNAVLTTVMAIAPVVGGFINKAVGWRGNYGIVALVSLCSWGMSYFFLPETKKHLEPFRIKTLKEDFSKLFRDSSFLCAAAAPSLMYAAYLSFIACSAFLYRETFGQSILVYTLHQASIVTSFSLVSLWAARIIQKFGNRSTVILGSVLSLLGAGSFLAVSIVSPYSPYFITFSMMIFCSGSAICYPVIFNGSLEIFPAMKGSASSAIMSMRSLITAIFVGLVGYLYEGQPLQIALVIMMAVIGGLIMVRILLKDEFFLFS